MKQKWTLFFPKNMGVSHNIGEMWQKEELDFDILKNTGLNY